MQLTCWNCKSSGIGPKFCRAPPVADAGRVKKNQQQQKTNPERAPDACDRAPGEHSVRIHLWWQCSKAIYITQGSLWIMFPPARSSPQKTLHHFSLACLATMEGILPCQRRPSVLSMAYLLQPETSLGRVITVIVAIKVLRHNLKAPGSFVSSFFRWWRFAANFTFLGFATINGEQEMWWSLRLCTQETYVT